MLEKAGQNNCHYTTVVRGTRKKTTKKRSLALDSREKKVRYGLCVNACVFGTLAVFPLFLFQ